MKARALPALAFAAVVWTPAVGRAGDDAPQTHQVAPPPRRQVEWSPAWPRFRAWEYVATAGVEAGSLYFRWYRPPPAQPKWVGDNPFDDTIRGWLRADSLDGRLRAGVASDWISTLGTAFPYAIDLPVALLVHRKFDVTWQLLMMDLEATAVSNFVNNLLFYEAGRGRPSTHDCTINASYDPICGGTGNNASFPSGHTVTIATSAGLTCVHHRYLPLYGDATADAGACVLMSAATLATGVTRIMADRHFATDVLLGAGIGFGTGYSLPWLLHYRTRSGVPEGRAPTAAAAVLPMAGSTGIGLELVGFL